MIACVVRVARRAGVTLFLLVLRAAPGGGQSAAHAGVPSQLKPATRAAIEALADSFTAARLPATALYDKAAEGVLKGADDATVLAAVRSLGQRLRVARDALGASAPGEDLIAASSALYAGLSPTQIRRIAEARTGHAGVPSLGFAITVLTNLVTRGVPRDAAAASVESLISRDARETDLTDFLSAVEGDIDRGRPPLDAATVRVQGTLRAIEARRPTP